MHAVRLHAPSPARCLCDLVAPPCDPAQACLHLFVTSARLFGAEAWAVLLLTTHSPVLQFLEYLVFAAFAFHAFNGLRLLIVELGFGIGRPDQPVYPYRGSVHRQRPLMIVTMILTAVLIAAGGFDLLRLSG